MTTSPMPGGRRRIDRVLAEDFLDGLAAMPLDDLRGRRRDAEQEEADLSFVRRMLQGRADILRAELARRGSSAEQRGDEALVERLSHALADPTSRSDHGMGRFLSVEPSRVDEHRRTVEQLLGDAGISDVRAQDEDGLGVALERIGAFEQEVSSNRRHVQQVMDALTGEVARRYRDGEARVDDLLAGQ